ncbi:phage tail protein [Chryseobacterium sp. TY4]
MKAINDAANQNQPTASYSAKTKALAKEYSTSTASGDLVTMKNDLLGAAGGSQAHNNLMPSLALKCVIAIQGLYPSRP